MSLGSYVACRLAPPADPVAWLRLVLRDAYEVQAEAGGGWSGVSVGGVQFGEVTAERWRELSRGWTPVIAQPAAVLYAGGPASGQLDLWDDLASFVLPELADATHGVVFFEDGEAVHRALPPRLPSFLDRLPVVLADDRQLGDALIREGGALKDYERLAVVERILAAPGRAAPRAEALLAWFAVRTDTPELLEQHRVDIVPFLELARAQAPGLASRIDLLIQRQLARRAEHEAETYAIEHEPSGTDLAALIRDALAGSARATAVLSSWIARYDWRSAASSPRARRERMVLGIALVDICEREPAHRARASELIMRLGFDEGLPRLRALLDRQRLAELEAAASARRDERARYEEAADWSDV